MQTRQRVRKEEISKDFCNSNGQKALSMKNQIGSDVQVGLKKKIDQVIN